MQDEPFNALPILMPLFGVMLGAGITFAYQSYFRWADRKRLDRERLRRLNMTFADLVQSVGAYHDAFIEQVKPDISPDLLWVGVLARPELDTTPIRFTADDTMVLQGPGANDVINEIRLLSARRNAAARGIDKYNALRMELGRALAPHITDLDGQRGFDVNGIRADPHLRMLESDANGLLGNLIQMMREQREECDALVPAYNAVKTRIAPDLKQGVAKA